MNGASGRERSILFSVHKKRVYAFSIFPGICKKHHLAAEEHCDEIKLEIPFEMRVLVVGSI